jgi:hypothetical protein
LQSILRDWTIGATPGKWVRRHGIWFWDLHKDKEWDEVNRRIFGVCDRTQVSFGLFYEHTS